MKVIIPKSPKGFHSHANDTFRSLATTWDLEIEYSDKTNFCWLNEIGDVLLYDRPTINWYLDSPEGYNKILLGNSLENSYKLPNSSPWIFWAREPKELEEFRRNSEILNYESRDITSIFIGKIENEVQGKYRNSDYSKVISHFELFQGKTNKYTQQEYLSLLKRSKFGLTLRGFGGKCNREIEYLGLGVVPLITPEVDLTYYNPLQENVHYIKINSPEDVQKIEKITQQQWETMSKNCLEYYAKNCSPSGSLKTTLEIINNWERDPIESFCTIATKSCQKDLELLLYSHSLIYPEVKIYVLCDSWIYKNLAKSNSGTSKQNQVFVNSLDSYGDCNRKQLESENKWLDFMLEKCTIIDHALKFHKNTVFIDSDIVILNKIPINSTKQLGLCPHFIKPENEAQFGKYNAGLLFISKNLTSSNSFTQWWKSTTKKNPKFFEQYALNYAPKQFSTFEFGHETDYGWWRMFESSETPKDRMSKWGVNPNESEITVNKKPLNTVHTHFFAENTNAYQDNFNNFLKNIFKYTPTTKLILDKINSLTPPQPPKSTEKIYILFQYYNDINPERQKEIDFCFKKNLEHPQVEKVVNFCEPQTVVPDHFKNNEKYVVVSTSSRLKYSTAFEYSQNIDNWCLLINADIFLMNLNLEKFTSKMVGCISRYEFDGVSQAKLDPNFAKLMHSHTQDGWLFKPPIKIDNCDFSLGKLGCDNAIADRIKKSGYIPVNMNTSIQLAHYDLARNKNSTNYMKKHDLTKTEKPEELGQFLVPSWNVMGIPFESLRKQLGITDIEIYEFICDIYSKRIKIKN